MSARRRRTKRRADLSQHFLRNGATPARLIESTSISAADLVVEIGPGRGALTAPLVSRAGKVIAIEIDPFFAAQLRERFGNQAEIVEGDFLQAPSPRRPYKLVGNLPFARTTEIMRGLADASRPPEDAWFIMQREAAQRFAGAPYVNETLWSLRLKPWWHVEIVRHLQRTDYDPPPSVDTVVIWLSRRTPPLLHGRDVRVYRGITERSYRLRDLRRGTRPWLTATQLRRLSHDLRFDTGASPAELAFEQWLGMVRFIMR